jgi:phosphatidylserine/phosphatidylglycerophosphate/cardiolipin synthase-like enzyme
VTIAALGEATNSVTAVIYKFDDPVLMAPIRTTIERGVRVQVLLDGKEAAKKKSQSAELVAAGAEVRIWPSDQGKLHAKFVIIDGVQALTGSYNWSRSGGDENVELLIVDTDRELIGALQEHFDVLWAKSLPISGP